MKTLTHKGAVYPSTTRAAVRLGAELGREVYDPETGEIDEELDALRAEALQDLDTGIETLAARVQRYETNAKICKEVAADYRSRADSWKRQADGLRALIGELLNVANKTKIKTALFTVSVRESAGALVIADEAEIPPEYIRTVESPDKSAIKAHLKAGGTLEGCRIETKQSVSLRVAGGKKTQENAH